MPGPGGGRPSLLVSPSPGGRGPSPAIHFLSDYGLADEFVGVVHAVLHRLAPTATVIDLSHVVPPFDVQAGADLLGRSAPHLGPGAVLAVVDPEVGTDRRAVAVAVDSADGPGWLVGPDNGLLLPAAGVLGPIARAVRLTAPTPSGTPRAGPSGRWVGATFDGRDVFAPAAAHLVLGGDPAVLGPDIDPAALVRLDPRQVAGPATTPDAPGLRAGAGWIDRFGNVQLLTTPDALSAGGLTPGGTALVTVTAGDGSVGAPWTARWVAAFAELGPEELGLMVDANGRPALVLYRSSAARRLGLSGPGAGVEITPRPHQGS